MGKIRSERETGGGRGIERSCQVHNPCETLAFTQSETESLQEFRAEHEGAYILNRLEKKDGRGYQEEVKAGAHLGGNCNNSSKDNGGSVCHSSSNGETG